VVTLRPVFGPVFDSPVVEDYLSEQSTDCAL
jgi:hypothetical protein